MIKEVIRVGVSTLALAAALYSGVVAAHGRVSMEEDTCMRRLGDNSMVHLSAYQPQYEPSDQYCTEIPKGATLFWWWTSWIPRSVTYRLVCASSKVATRQKMKQ